MRDKQEQATKGRAWQSGALLCKRMANPTDTLHPFCLATFIQELHR